MDLSDLMHHKTALIVVGGVVGGAVLFSFMHKGSSSSTTSATTFNPSSGSTVNPSQYLVPYNAYFTGGMPDGGSTSSGSSGGTVSAPTTSTTSTGNPSSGWAGTNPPQSTPTGTSTPSSGGQTLEQTQAYNKVWTTAQSKAAAAAGQTQYGLINGQYVPVMVGNTPTSLYKTYEAANNNTGALYTLTGS